MPKNQLSVGRRCIDIGALTRQNAQSFVLVGEPAHRSDKLSEIAPKAVQLPHIEDIIRAHEMPCFRESQQKGWLKLRFDEAPRQIYSKASTLGIV